MAGSPCHGRRAESQRPSLRSSIPPWRHPSPSAPAPSGLPSSVRARAGVLARPPPWMPVPSPKQQVSSAPYISHGKQQAPPRPGVLAAQLGLASSLSGHTSRCSTARTTYSTICATGCMWSCWCSAQRLRDVVDLRSACESSTKPAVSSLLFRTFRVRLKGRTNESHNKLCNDCVCHLIVALVDVAPHESARLLALNDCDLFYLRIRSMMCLRVYMRVKIYLYEWTRVEKENEVEKELENFYFDRKCVMRCLMRKLSYKMWIMFWEMHRYVFV
jgi:hypothetical protein